MRQGIGGGDLDLHGLSGKDLTAHIALRQYLCCLFAEGILDQSPLECLLFFLRFLRPGQKGCGFDVDQPRRHFQELSGKLQILFPALIQIRQILFQQTGDLNVIDVQLVLGDQAQEQIHRPFKDLQLKRDLLHKITSPSAPVCRSTGSPTQRSA